MACEFPIIEVPESASIALEAMGSKPKFWFDDEARRSCLFKESRPGTGEDWAEKVAAELAGRLGLPHAVVELARCGDRRGTVSPTFVPPGGALIHGNEILGALEHDYPGGPPGSTRFVRIPEHTVEAVLSANRASGLAPPPDWAPVGGVTSAIDVMVGYLLLDAWIGNTDRHHENWGWLVVPKPGGDVSAHLAPTFDHASSLGRELSDEERRERLTTRDSNRTVAAYVVKARSALYANKGAKKPLSPLNAFVEASRAAPAAAIAWRNRLAAVTRDGVEDVFARLPRDRCSVDAAMFARGVLERTSELLLKEA